MYEVTVNSLGMIEQIFCIKSSGHALLDKAAKESLKRGKFTPATKAGEAITSSKNISFNFQLKNANSH